MSGRGWQGYDAALLLIRHGEAAANRRGAFIGRLDEPLTEKGIHQAEGLAGLLAERAIDALFCSPLRRARQTAAVLEQSTGVPAQVDDRLCEQDFGQFEGLTFEQARNRFPAAFASWWREPGCPPPGGEALTAVSERMQAFYDGRCAAATAGKTIAVVGHAGALQSLICRLFGIETRSPWPFRLQTGTLTEIQFIGGRPTLVRLSLPGS